MQQNPKLLHCDVDEQTGVAGTQVWKAPAELTTGWSSGELQRSKEYVACSVHNIVKQENYVEFGQWSSTFEIYKH